jgi:uncharacterized repeat protein (TIGR03803 family)
MLVLRQGRSGLAAGLVLTASLVLTAPRALAPGDLAAAPAPGDLAAARASRSCAITLRPTPFAGGNDGANPDSNLIQAGGGSLYGTTPGLGGADSDFGHENSTAGTIFRLSPEGRLTSLHAFTERDEYGNYLAHPDSGLAYARGAFYGLTAGENVMVAGTSEEIVSPDTMFRITPAGALTTLESFTPPGDNDPETDLLSGPGGVLYGASRNTIFELTVEIRFITLHRFNPRRDAYGPAGPLLLGRGGVIYGTSAPGGGGRGGTVFRLRRDGTFTTLHVFNGPVGSGPEGALIQDDRGNLYGETMGEVNDDGHEVLPGTVFKLTPAGALTTLYSFSYTHIADGYYPVGGLTWGPDGNLYGVTQFGGAADKAGNTGGTIFRLTPAGALTTLYSFTDSHTDGSYPLARLTLARDGKFYGTASVGGAHGDGTVFRFAPPQAGCAIEHRPTQPLRHDTQRPNQICLATKRQRWWAGAGGSLEGGPLEGRGPEGRSAPGADHRRPLPRDGCIPRTICRYVVIS